MSDKITVQSQEKKYPPLWPRYLIELIGVLLIYFLTKETVDFTGLNQRGLAIAKQTVIGLMHPSMKLILDPSSVGLGHMLLETLAIAFLGTVIGIILALPLAFLSSRNVAPVWMTYIFLTVISLIRAFPSFFPIVLSVSMPLFLKRSILAIYVI